MNKPLVRTGLLCLITFGLMSLLGGPMVIRAQGPDETGEKEPIVIASSGRLNLTFEQLGHETKHLDREDDSRYYRVRLPGNFQIWSTGNYLDLVTYHFPEIPNKPSVLKVAVNGDLLSTFPLTGSNALSNTVRINLPEGSLQAPRCKKIPYLLQPASIGETKNALNMCCD